mgnify:CR=1 FL=1
MKLRVFVYGTLKPGEYYFSEYCEPKMTACVAAIAPGCLYDLPLGYPAMTPGTGWVSGVLMEFDDPQVLAALDELEGYEPGRSPEENEYIREQLEVFTPEGRSLGLAWVYRMSQAIAEQLGGVWLPEGYWTGRNLQAQ